MRVWVEAGEWMFGVAQEGFLTPFSPNLPQRLPPPPNVSPSVITAIGGIGAILIMLVLSPVGI